MNLRSTANPPRTPRPGALSCLGLAAVLGLAPEVRAQEPKPGEPLTVTVQGEKGRVSLTFRYCPKGAVRPGKPRPRQAEAQAEGALKIDDTTPIAGFHISEAEVTLEQFSGLLGDGAVEAMLDRLAEYQLQAAAAVRQANASEPEIPVYMATLDDVALFCRALGERYTPPGVDPALRGIVSYRFRIPTHAEWQYACRAQQSPDATPARPHFNRWPGPEEVRRDRRLLSRAQRLWRKLHPSGEEFQATQEQLVEMLLACEENDLPEARELLIAFLQMALGTKRDFGESMSQPRPVKADSKPNDWALSDMHDGVGEWVISDHGRSDALWDAVLDPDRASTELRERPGFLVAGGSFSQALFEGDRTSWRYFTIWGANPMSVDDGETHPFSLDAERAKHENTKDFSPGFRLVYLRALSDDWLLTLRRDAVLAGAPTDQTLGRLQAMQQAAQEVASAGQRGTIDSRFNYYRALALYRMGQRAQALELLRAGRPADAPRFSLSALGGGGEAPGARDDERTFTDVLAYLVEKER